MVTKERTAANRALLEQQLHTALADLERAHRRHDYALAADINVEIRNILDALGQAS